MIDYWVVNTNPKRLDRMHLIIPEFNVFQGTTGPDPKKAYTEYIPKTYQRLAIHGVKHKFDHKTIVLQDDVWVPHGAGFEAMHDEYATQAELVIYGRQDATGLICPLMFSATPMIWKLLVVDWDGERRICDAWRGTVDKHGLVLNLAKPLGGPPSVPKGNP